MPEQISNLTPRQLAIYIENWSKDQESPEVKDVTKDEIDMFNLVAGIPRKLIKK